MGKAYDVAIVGTGFSEIARHATRSLGALTVEACERAAADAGVDLLEVDGLANYPNASRLGAGTIEGVDIASVNFVARAFAFRNLRWASSLTQGTVTASLVEAVNAIKGGSCRYALVWRSMHNPIGVFNTSRVAPAEGNTEFTAPYGLSIPITTFAMIFSTYLARYGRTRADMAEFIVSNRENAARNPDAIFYGKPLNRDAYLSSDIVSSPLGYLDCDMPVDGCGALLLSRADIAKDLRNVPAYVAGAAALGLERLHRPIMTYDSFRASAKGLVDSLASACEIPFEDIQHLNLYDGFSYFTPMMLEAFGYCSDGEAFDMIASGQTAPDGRWPLNTSGGALGMGRLHGTPQVIEAVRQVQGVCGDRQVPGVTNALAQSGGLLTGAGALVFTRDARTS